MGNGSYWDGATWSNVQVDSPFDKAKVFVLSEAPVEPTPMRTGDLFIDTDTAKLSFRNGATWTPLSELATIADIYGLQTVLDQKAPLVSPTFTGTVSGITKGMVGLDNVDNTHDTDKPVSTAQQAALDLKANLASPTFTGTVGGITKSMVGLANVDNTSDLSKPISTATQSALNLKSDTTHTHSVLSLSDWPSGLTITELGYLDGVTSSIQSQLNGKQAAGSYAAASHTHTKSQITDFSHTHTLSNITDYPTATAKMTKSSTGPSYSASTWTQVTGFDTLNYSSGITSSASTGRFTISTAGDYHIEFYQRWQYYGSAFRRQAAIVLGTSAPASNNSNVISGNASNHNGWYAYTLSASQVSLSAGDIITFWVWSDTGSTFNNTTNTPLPPDTYALIKMV